MNSRRAVLQVLMNGRLVGWLHNSARVVYSVSSMTSHGSTLRAEERYLSRCPWQGVRIRD